MGWKETLSITTMKLERLFLLSSIGIGEGGARREAWYLGFPSAPQEATVPGLLQALLSPPTLQGPVNQSIQQAFEYQVLCCWGTRQAQAVPRGRDSRGAEERPSRDRCWVAETSRIGLEPSGSSIAATTRTQRRGGDMGRDRRKGTRVRGYAFPRLGQALES